MLDPYVYPGRGRFEPMRVNTPVYACGDCHGRADLLNAFIDWVGDDRRRGEAVVVVFLGDYVDRGGQSRQCIERLMRGPDRPGEIWIPLKGNHDSLFARAWRNPGGIDAANWALNGALSTMASYGAISGNGFPRLVPETHIRFLEGLHLAVDDGERLYVHAGIRPGIAIEDQTEHDMMWIRSPFLDEPHGVNRLIVHGHTIFKNGPNATPWRFGIDTGAYATGCLTGVRFDPGNSIPRVWQSDIGLLLKIATPWVSR